MRSEKFDDDDDDDDDDNNNNNNNNNSLQCVEVAAFVPLATAVSWLQLLLSVITYFCKASRPSLGPTQPSIQSVPVFFRRLKAAGTCS